MNSVQSSAVMAHVSREFDSNASRLSRSARLMGPAEASSQRTGYSNLDLGHLECGMARGPTTFAPIPNVAAASPRDRNVNGNVCSGLNLTVARRQLVCRAIQRSPAICYVRSASSGRTGQIAPVLPVKIGSMNAREARESGLRLKA